MKRKSGRKSRWSAWLMAFVLAAGIGALNGPFAVQAQAVSPSGVSESVVDSASVSSDDSSVTGEETASESVLTNDSEDVQEEASGIVGTADAVSETSDESAIDVSEDAGQDNSDTDAEAAMVSAYSDAGELSGYTVDDNAKTITVPSDKSIQAAINYISGTTDKVGWTITVEDGIYSRFAVLDGLDNLVIQAANQGEATVNVLDGSTPEGVSFGGGHPNDEGIIVWNADNVTIDGFVINSTSAMSSPWYAASLSTYSESTEKADNMTVKNCTFTGSGKYGIFCCSGTRTITIDHNTFESGISEAIEFMCDGNDAGGSSIIGNTFNGNSFAIHGYWGGTPGENPSLTVSGNILNGAGSGTTDRRCKIVIEDQISQGSVKPDVSENTINNGVIGLVNISNTSAEDVISGNTMNEGSFAVDAKEPGTIDLYSNYKVYQGDYHFGYWALTNIDDDNKLDVSWGGNPGDTIKVVQAAIDEANAEHSNVLSINADMNGELIRTFTWFKDAVYWVPYDNGSLTVSKSSDSIVKSGETFTFEIQLTGDGIDGQQVFYDGNVSDGTQANPRTFTDGKAEITLSKGESLTLEGIPAGTTFTVTETGADEYNTLPAEKAISGTIVKDETATAEFTNARTRNITVRKVWDDADNQDGIRPDSVTIRLLANDKAAKDTKGQDITAVVTGGEDGSWTNSFEDLPVYDREGTEITYTITEDEVNGYTTEVTGKAEDGFIITNTHTPDQTGIKVSKVWDDANNQDGSRPESVTVHLLADGEVTGEPVTLSAENDWSASFTDLPLNKAGSKIEYTVSEDEIDGYTSAVNGDAEEGFVITNTLTPEAAPETVTVNPSAEKKITGDTPDKKAGFSFLLKAADASNPMPEGSTNGSITAKISGAGSVSFGEINFTEAGTYKYSVSEVKGDDTHYTYDESSYELVYTVTEKDGKLTAASAVTKDGKSAGSITFTNKYTADGSTPSNQTSNTGNSTNAGNSSTAAGSVKTGDSTPIAPYAGLLTAAAAALVIVLVVRNRKARRS